MWKITLIAWIIFIVLKRIFDVLIEAMSVEEKLIFKYKETIPSRLVIVGGITILSFLISVILTIITIVTW